MKKNEIEIYILCRRECSVDMFTNWIALGPGQRIFNVLILQTFITR